MFSGAVPPLEEVLTSDEAGAAGPEFLVFNDRKMYSAMRTLCQVRSEVDALLHVVQDITVW